MVKLPSGKLQISKPFSLSDSVVNFVYDITVHKAGKSGKYILNPQIAQSGPDQEFVEVKYKEKAEKPGKPENAAKHDNADIEVKIEGTIESLTEDSVTVSGVTVLIDERTKIEGALTEGAEVEVEATAFEEDLVASKIEVKAEE